MKVFRIFNIKSKDVRRKEMTEAFSLNRRSFYYTLFTREDLNFFDNFPGHSSLLFTSNHAEQKALT